MNLVRWEERNRLWPSTLLRDLETHLDRFFGPGEWPWYGGAWVPAADIRETDAAYVIEVDLPGMTKDQIELEMVDNVVTIKGERKETREDKKGGLRRYERTFGRFERSFTLPGGFDASKAEAEYAGGVLRVTLPKREEHKPKRIDVKFN